MWMYLATNHVSSSWYDLKYARGGVLGLGFTHRGRELEFELGALRSVCGESLITTVDIVGVIYDNLRVYLIT